MKILYVPDFMRAALKAAGAEDSVLYSIEKLANTVSPEDVAFYLYVNLDLKTVMPEDIAISLPNALTGQNDPFATGSDCKRVKEALRILNEYCLNGSAPKLNLSTMELTCDLMDENTIRFTHIPIDASAASSDSELGKRGLYDRVIQQLYAFIPFEKLAQMPLFAGYLKASQAVLSGNALA